jgi:hypothetical protein
MNWLVSSDNFTNIRSTIHTHSLYNLPFSLAVPPEKFRITLVKLGEIEMQVPK